MMTEQFDLFVEDLLGEKQERPLVIVGASKVDDLLLLILSKYLLPKLSKDKDDLLEGDRPLATFSSRLKIVYRLCIIDKDFFQILDRLRTIRNLSAHQINFDLKKSPLRDHVEVLLKEVKKRKSFELTKNRYFSGVADTDIQNLQCAIITLCVILQSILEKTTITSGNPETIRISKK